MALRVPETGAFQDQLIQAPRVARLNGHTVYSMIFGGVLWMYYVSSHISGREVPVTFREDGVLTLGVQDWLESKFVQDAARILQSDLFLSP